MKKEKIFRIIILIVAVVINIFIIANGMIDVDNSAKESNVVSQVAESIVNTVQPETITETNRSSFYTFNRKFLGHFCLFGLSGLFSTASFVLFLKNTKLRFPLISCGFSVIIGFLVAYISELIQKMTPGRIFSMRDVWIDFTGYILGLIGILIIWLILKFVIEKENEKKQA